MNIWNDHFLDSSHHHQIPPLTIDLNDELMEEVDDEEHQFFSTTPAPKYNYSQPSSSSSSSQTFFFPPQDHGDHHNPYANQLSYHNYHEDHQGQVSAPQGGGSYMGGINENQNVPNSLGTSVKWMSSKMRIMRKMMNPVPSDHHSSKQFYNNYHEDDHKQASTSPEADHSSSNVKIRVCSDCNTTKTPLWRSGPRGPKSLCNACGIRQRKARRAAMAAAAAGNGSAAAEIMTAIAPNKSKLQCKKRSKGGGGTCVAQLKKKCKLEHSPAVVLSEELKDSDSNSNNDNNNKKKLCFEDLRLILSKNSAFQRAVFPQDEKEGAILLMALSYGLVQS